MKSGSVPTGGGGEGSTFRVIMFRILAPVLLFGGVVTAQDESPPASPPGAEDAVTDPVLVSRVEPRYPEAARVDVVEANVVFRAEVSREGRVVDVITSRCEVWEFGASRGPEQQEEYGHHCAAFEAEGRKAALQFVYEPALLHGEPVAVPITVTVNWTYPGPFLAGVGDVSNPVLVSKTPLRYPSAAHGDRVEARVIYQAVITADGRVTDVKVLRCEVRRSGKKWGRKQQNKHGHHCLEFELAGRECIEEWNYEPALDNGTPVAVYFTITASWTLHK